MDNLLFDSKFKQLVKGYFNYVLSTFNNEVKYQFTNYNDYEQFYLDQKELFFRYRSLDFFIRNNILDFNFEVDGFCSVCNKNTKFTIDSRWSIFSEGITCNNCRCNSRIRNIFRYINNYYKSNMKVYINEQSTRFFKILKNDYIHDIIGSEYQPDINSNFRHEDCCDLSFNNDSFNMYVSNDVFEHVFDYKKAFLEAYRVLKKSGIFIFHVPFTFKKSTFIRAIQQNNTIQYLAPQVYHGDPIHKECLCINDFGFDILDSLRECGFSEVKILFENIPSQLIFSLSNIVFLCIK